ncbi:response regulator receiver domain protein [Rhodopseudomonas palustris HaA2]|uniref:Response regulator receiver domain protein n=1 Tax=Rhodopseudomonas palustris (strain HaA2) TaxID=316058 RepID=Q2J3R6_RHOP2|nr:response regulator [Rhodopseudomonas palustris]ABD04894.1 response regulator receiver domain protein [Rhodopseudomonas palustris HaA2]
MTIGKIVAVIDDDENVRIAIEGLVRSLGHRARGFASAQQFLESDVDASAGCLITDVQMPGLNGLDLYAKLVADCRAPPVVFITAFPDERIEARARALGALGFLSKPFDAQTLVHCIQQALSAGAGPSHR